MSNRNQGLLLLVIGVLLFLVALTADSLGIGSYAGLGWKQVVGAVVGVAIAGVGITRLRKG